VTDKVIEKVKKEMRWAFLILGIKLEFSAVDFLLFCPA